MMRDELHELAVIIPVGPNEQAWRALLPDLSPLPESAKIVLVGSTSEPEDFSEFLRQSAVRQTVQWIKAPRGRAVQLNTAVHATKKRFLWFLHADSRLSDLAIPLLAQSLRRGSNVLHYFDLAFLADGPPLMAVNRVGVWIRSHWMRLPFGDQGFCLSRELFEQLGGFKEDAPYGEDHLLVWAAHQRGIPLRCVGAAINTSARRYRERGWAKATAVTMFLTAKQALPELLKLARSRRAHD